ncbi:hypothetical protein KEM55_004094 [Ascosphaera atra]|nr:hypothetical protein KEM55_004094 [Ascosphaera atra]
MQFREVRHRKERMRRRARINEGTGDKIPGAKGMVPGPTKHGVLGLMRALRPYLPESHKTRVNAVLPWMTDTAITKGIKKQWEAAGCPINTPKQVAEIMMGMLAEERMNGKATFVGSGRAFEIEENLDRLEPQWLGEEPSTWLTKGQATLGNGLNWAQ